VYVLEKVESGIRNVSDPAVNDPVTALESVMVPGEVIPVMVTPFPMPLPVTTIPSAKPLRLLMPLMVAVLLAVPVRNVEVDT
jgi:hypothetical protein